MVPTLGGSGVPQAGTSGLRTSRLSPEHLQHLPYRGWMVLQTINCLFFSQSRHGKPPALELACGLYKRDANTTTIREVYVSLRRKTASRSRLPPFFDTVGRPLPDHCSPQTTCLNSFRPANSQRMIQA